MFCRGYRGKSMQAAGLVLTSYQDSLSRAMDIVSNNIANVGTSGFKRETIKFDTLVRQTSPGQGIFFSVDHGTFREIAQGPMTTTGNPLDVAIQGEGYFPVQTKNGTRYTRSGVFMLNSQGEIVTPSGDKLLGDGDQPITVPEDGENLTISPDGIVVVKTGTTSSMAQIGKIKLVKFQNEQELQMVGGNLYSTMQQPEQVTDSKLVQGMVEGSNVQSVTEMTRMIEIMRSYQHTVRLLDLENQRQNNAISRLSKATA